MSIIARISRPGDRVEAASRAVEAARTAQSYGYADAHAHYEAAKDMYVVTTDQPVHDVPRVCR